jgi:hypothetical protein
MFDIEFSMFSRVFDYEEFKKLRIPPLKRYLHYFERYDVFSSSMYTKIQLYWVRKQ